MILTTLKTYAQAIIAVVALVALLATGFAGYRFGANSVLASQVREDKKLAAVEDRATLGAAKAIAKIKVQNRTINQEVQREVRIVPDYSACQHSPAGLLGVNAALAGPGAEGADRGVVPDADTAR